MDARLATELLIRFYPRIYHACHQRHVRDPATLKEVSAHAAGILDHLDTREPTFVSALAQHMGVTASTMSLALDRLEAAGYVLRVRDAGDGRKVGVVLTEAGDRLRLASSVLDSELVQQLVGSMNEADRDAAINGLGLLAEAAGRMSKK